MAVCPNFITTIIKEMLSAEPNLPKISCLLVLPLMMVCSMVCWFYSFIATLPVETQPVTKSAVSKAEIIRRI